MACFDKNMDYSDIMDFLNEPGKVNLRCVPLGMFPRVTSFPLNLVSFGYIRNNWHNNERINNSLLFGLVLNTPGGILHRIINGCELREHCPVFGFCRPGMRWRNLSPNPWDEIYFSYEPGTLAVLKKTGFPVPCRHPAVITPALVELMRKIISLVINHQAPGNIDRIDMLAFQIMQECLIASAAPPDNDPVDALVKEVLSLMRLNHRNAADLKGFLRKRGVGYRTFLRRWHAVIPQNPSHYALDLRMAEARQMLGAAGMSVKSIANELGFDDPLYFSRMFRRQTGMSPTAFRKILGTGQAHPA